MQHLGRLGEAQQSSDGMKNLKSAIGHPETTSAMTTAK
jgi:hypothetical protein